MRTTTRITLDLLAEGECPYPGAMFSQEEGKEILAEIKRGDKLQKEINDANKALTFAFEFGACTWNPAPTLAEAIRIILRGRTEMETEKNKKIAELQKEVQCLTEQLSSQR